MFIPQIILGPAVGAAIGYMTNALAIKMLFRPYEAKYIFGVKIPFTPGIIPKEKGRIAISLGTAISENLMNHEVLERNLLSDEMVAKIDGAIAAFFTKQQFNTETLRQFAEHYIPAADLDRIVASVKGELGQQVGQRLAQAELGTQIADAVIDHVSAKLSVEGLNIPLAGAIGKIFKGKVWQQLAQMVQAPARIFLSKNINKMLIERGPEMAQTMLGNQIESLLQTPVNELLAGREAQLDEVREGIMGLYRRLISDELPRILATINIPAIIESRINEMDMRETEQLIFAVMRKELQAIIWLGAGLGLAMGFLNALL